MVAYEAPGEMTSPKWARGFAEGCGGEVAGPKDLLPGDVATFGSPQTWALLQQAIREGRTWFYGDHGYFGRHNAPIGGPAGDVYYRVTRGAYQHDGRGDGDMGRLERLGVEVKPWRRDSGGYVLLCPNSPTFFRLHGENIGLWTAGTVETLRRHTTREIRVREKTSPRTFAQDLAGAWAVVVFTSACGYLAALEGVPCFATAPCASLAFGSGNLALIETPVRPDNRRELASVLAANQWTLAEIARGQAWERLQ